MQELWIALGSHGDPIGIRLFIAHSYLFGPQSKDMSFFTIPGFRYDRVLHDPLHSQLLGTGKVTNGIFTLIIV